MGQASRTTKLLLDLSPREEGGANSEKRGYLQATVAILNRARAFYLDFFLAHPAKLTERVPVTSKTTGEEREALISTDQLLTWAEFQTVATQEHPNPIAGWNFSQQFPDFPNRYRRSVIKDSLGKARGYLTAIATWQASGKKTGKPGLPAPRNHPTLYDGTHSLELDALDLRHTFVRLKVFTGKQWRWVNYPTHYNRFFEKRRTEPGWEMESPKLIVRKQGAAVHFLQTKEIKAEKIVASKKNPDVVTVAVDLNVKMLAVVTVRQHGKIIETVFVRDHGLDQHRYRHLKQIARKQWQSGEAVKGERSNQDLWRHVKRMNQDAAHTTAHAIVEVCQKYPGCVLLFERLRKMKQGAMSKSRRLNRKQANQLKGRINQVSKEKAYACGVVAVEVNAHGTSQFCASSGARGERFSIRGGQAHKERGGKLFRCACGYVVQADYNASVNVHHSFYQEWHWQPRRKKRPRALSG